MRRATAQYIGGTKIRFIFDCGHTQTKDFSQGPISKRMGALGCKLMAHYWSKQGGGVNARCPRCKRLGCSTVPGR